MDNNHTEPSGHDGLSGVEFLAAAAMCFIVTGLFSMLFISTIVKVVFGFPGVDPPPRELLPTHQARDRTLEFWRGMVNLEQERNSQLAALEVAYQAARKEESGKRALGYDGPCSGTKDGTRWEEIIETRNHLLRLRYESGWGPCWLKRFNAWWAVYFTYNWSSWYKECQPVPKPRQSAVLQWQMAKTRETYWKGVDNLLRKYSVFPWPTVGASNQGKGQTHLETA